MSNVLVVGSVTVDVTAFADRLPAPGETVIGRDVTLVLGGKGANQAAAAARFGASTSMVGCVGDDLFADLALDGLRSHGVVTERLRAVSGPTGVAHIRVSADGQNDIVITPLANDHVSSDDVDAAIAPGSADTGVLLLQLEIPGTITAYAAAAGRAAGLLTILDPAPAAQLPDDIWADIDIVTPNESEAAALTGIPVSDASSARRAAAWFLERGVARVIVTLGDKGAVLVSDTEDETYQSIPVRAVDTTAAGDAFTGTLGGALAESASVDQAIRLAMAAGALAVTRPGASPSLPTRSEIQELLDGSTPATTQEDA